MAALRIYFLICILVYVNLAESEALNLLNQIKAQLPEQETNNEDLVFKEATKQIKKQQLPQIDEVDSNDDSFRDLFKAGEQEQIINNDERTSDVFSSYIQNLSDGLETQNTKEQVQMPEVQDADLQIFGRLKKSLKQQEQEQNIQVGQEQQSQKTLTLKEKLEMKKKQALQQNNQTILLQIEANNVNQEQNQLQQDNTVINVEENQQPNIQDFELDISENLESIQQNDYQNSVGKSTLMKKIEEFKKAKSLEEEQQKQQQTKNSQPVQQNIENNKVEKQEVVQEPNALRKLLNKKAEQKKIQEQEKLEQEKKEIEEEQNKNQLMQQENDEEEKMQEQIEQQGDLNKNDENISLKEEQNNSEKIHEQVLINEEKQEITKENFDQKQLIETQETNTSLKIIQMETQTQEIDINQQNQIEDSIQEKFYDDETQYLTDDPQEFIFSEDESDNQSDITFQLASTVEYEDQIVQQVQQIDEKSEETLSQQSQQNYNQIVEEEYHALNQENFEETQQTDNLEIEIYNEIVDEGYLQLNNLSNEIVQEDKPSNTQIEESQNDDNKEKNLANTIEKVDVDQSQFINAQQQDDYEQRIDSATLDTKITIDSNQSQNIESEQYKQKQVQLEEELKQQQEEINKLKEDQQHLLEQLQQENEKNYLYQQQLNQNQDNQLKQQQEVSQQQIEEEMVIPQAQFSEDILNANNIIIKKLEEILNQQKLIESKQQQEVLKQQEQLLQLQNQQIQSKQLYKKKKEINHQTEAKLQKQQSNIQMINMSLEPQFSFQQIVSKIDRERTKRLKGSNKHPKQQQESVDINFFQLTEQQQENKNIFSQKDIFKAIQKEMIDCSSNVYTKNSCKLCQSEVAYEINDDNWYLIGIAYGLKRQFQDLLNTVQYHFNKARIFTSFNQESQVCITLGENIEVENLQEILLYYNNNQTINILNPLVKIPQKLKADYAQMKVDLSKHQYSNFSFVSNMNQRNDYNGFTITEQRLYVADQIAYSQNGILHYQQHHDAQYQYLWDSSGIEAFQINLSGEIYQNVLNHYISSRIMNDVIVGYRETITCDLITVDNAELIEFEIIIEK